MVYTGASYGMNETTEYAPYSTGANIVQYVGSTCLLIVITVPIALPNL